MPLALAVLHALNDTDVIVRSQVSVDGPSLLLEVVLREHQDEQVTLHNEPEEDMLMAVLELEIGANTRTRVSGGENCEDPPALNRVLYIQE